MMGGEGEVEGGRGRRSGRERWREKGGGRGEGGGQGEDRERERGGREEQGGKEEEGDRGKKVRAKRLSGYKAENLDLSCGHPVLLHVFHGRGSAVDYKGLQLWRPHQLDGLYGKRSLCVIPCHG